jgi:hypothetical protein
MTIVKIIQKRDRTKYQPKIGLCECGQKVELEHFTNTCYGCERDYCSAGSELADRSQWGEETGETAFEIFQYNNMSTDELLEDEMSKEEVYRITLRGSDVGAMGEIASSLEMKKELVVRRGLQIMGLGSELKKTGDPEDGIYYRKNGKFIRLDLSKP